MKISNESLKWFNNARFGMFIHWGLYSIPGRGEWLRYAEDVPQEEYKKLAEIFNPKKFRPDEWAAIAKAAGMRYMVLTTKHHDGFCLYDSKYTDFTSVKSAAKRDFVAEYVEACRNAGLGVGLYFSVKDWSFPGYFKGPENDPEGWNKLVTHFQNQALELMSNYGKIDILFYDCADDANFRGGWGDKTADVWGSGDLNKKIRELQPGILINNRSGLEEDYGTPEQEIPIGVVDNDRFYECCMTMNNTWGYNSDDNNWKNTNLLLEHLTACAARGSNYLLNVGPNPDGVIPDECVKRLYEMGSWLKEHGEAVYGTERVLPSWWDVTANGRITTKDNFAYVLINTWKHEGEVVIIQLKNQVKRATLLVTGEELEVRREGRRIIISGLPIHAPSNFINVIKLELDGLPEAQYYY